MSSGMGSRVKGEEQRAWKDIVEVTGDIVKLRGPRTHVHGACLAEHLCTCVFHYGNKAKGSGCLEIGPGPEYQMLCLGPLRTKHAPHSGVWSDLGLPRTPVVGPSSTLPSPGSCPSLPVLAVVPKSHRLNEWFMTIITFFDPEIQSRQKQMLHFL